MLDRARCACENADVAACLLAAFPHPASRGAPQQYVHDTTASIYKNTPLALLGPKWDQLLAEARSLSSAGQHAIAIIIAAAAGEWATELVLERLMDAVKDHSKRDRKSVV